MIEALYWDKPPIMLGVCATKVVVGSLEHVVLFVHLSGRIIPTDFCFSEGLKPPISGYMGMNQTVPWANLEIMNSSMYIYLCVWYYISISLIKTHWDSNK